MARIIEGDIRELKHQVLDMAELILMQLGAVTEAITYLDHKLAEKVRRKEKKVDKYDISIDKKCERIIALYQPVANDLRFVFTVVKINSALEQTGDLIAGIARKIFEIRDQFDPALIEELRLKEMMELTREIVAQSLNAFFRENVESSKEVFAKDDAIDDIHRAAFGILVHRIQQRPEKTAEYIQLHLIMKSLEKIADFAVSIAEESIFQQEGVVYKHSSMKRAHREETGRQEVNFSSAG